MSTNELVANDQQQTTKASSSPNNNGSQKPKLTVRINTKQETKAHKIDNEGNIVDSPNCVMLEKMKNKLLSHDSLNDKTVSYKTNDTHSRENDASLDRLCSIDSVKSVGSEHAPKKCKYHPETDASWICEKCKCYVCELCSRSKVQDSDPIVCRHCFDEMAKDMNMIWLVVGAFFLGIVFPPLLVAAPIVVIMRSHNEKFKRIGWIMFWLVIFGIFSLFGSGFITTISLKYAGKL